MVCKSSENDTLRRNELVTRNVGVYQRFCSGVKVTPGSRKRRNPKPTVEDMSGVCG